MNIIEQIRQFVEQECKKSTSHYGYEPFLFHFIPMVKYCEQLAERLGADKQIVVLAGWLHDIGSIIHGRKDHHVTGARIAAQKLREFDYPEEKIELIKKCILNHRGSVANRRETIEEQIVADADAISNFDNISGILKAAFTYEDLDQKEAQKSALRKLSNKWEKLHFEESRKIIKPKYEAAILLLR